MDHASSIYTAFQDYISSPAMISNSAMLVLASIGLIFVGAKLMSYARLLLSIFVLPGQSLRTFGPKGSWAVVTGASDGIGKEFAIQLAQKGFNLILISRTESKLQTLAHEIEAKYAGSAVKTKILAMDFAKNQDDDYARLKGMVEGLDVAILINNVGKSHDMPVPFILTPKQEMADIIMINCMGTLKVTQIVTPGMTQRRRGLILTMGSMGGLLPTPLLATYSGSKAFLQQWSTALGSELKPHGVQVELVISYLVTSAMSKIRRPSALVPNPRNFVKTVLAKIGCSGGAQDLAHTSTPYWSHALVHWFLASFTGLSGNLVVDRNRIMHEDIRRKALKKKERDAKKVT
ncbi:MAG: hypothetical protein M1838_002186 [Thelocarpon superellum]|nr:MAG: hypothetical protein M1838_002186 [Thelocarpon superellum]